MTSEPNLIISFAAGVISFLSPCVLPLIPSYLSFIGGVSLDDLKQDALSRRPVVLRTVFFVAGFSAVFIVLGAAFTGSGMLVGGAFQAINLIAGGIVILLGLNVIFDFWKFLNIERKVHVSSVPKGYIGASLFGMAFGAGWTPCIGPILAGILFMAGRSGRLATGILYLAVYSLGLGLPFLIAGAFFPAFLRGMDRIKRHMTTIRVAGGVFLMGIGALIAFGRLQRFNATLISWGLAIRQWESAGPTTARVALGAIAVGIGLLPLVIALARRALAGREEVRLLSLPKGVFLAVFALVGALQLGGVINLAGILHAWLTFQGI
ncbi:MAG: cytochrome c biogenesis protein CcdA [bacterium]